MAYNDRRTAESVRRDGSDVGSQQADDRRLIGISFILELRAAVDKPDEIEQGHLHNAEIGTRLAGIMTVRAGSKSARASNRSCTVLADPWARRFESGDRIETQATGPSSPLSLRLLRPPHSLREDRGLARE